MPLSCLYNSIYARETHLFLAIYNFNMAATSPNSDDLLSRLKFRAVQPVDIPRCHHLETLSFTADNAASTSELQLRQHRAAPFFRCVLLNKPKQEKVEHDLGDLEISNGNDNHCEACHHSVHGTSENELIGYISGTRVLDFVDVDAVLSADRNELQQPTESTYLYSTNHEPNGRYLVIHSLVVQQEYRNLGVARAMLVNYINAMEILNGEADEAGINRRRNKLKGVKTKIEKIVVLTDSTLLDFFISVGFRWRRTLTLGANPLYELEMDLRQSPTTLLLETPSSLPKLEPECYLVNSFANLKRWGSGNSAAIVLLQGAPKEIVGNYETGIWGDILLNTGEDDEEELANARADVWMHYVAKDFPSTAFVWKKHDFDDVDSTRDRCWSEGGIDGSQHSFGLEYDSAAELQSTAETSGPCEIQYYTRFMTGGNEVDMCAHALLAAASVLFRKYASTLTDSQDIVLAFHSRNGIVLRALRAPPSQLEEEVLGSEMVSNSNSMSDNIRISMEYPWRTVAPLSQEDHSSIVSLLRRAFFGAWSVVPPEEDDNDETDGLAFSLKVDDVLYIGLTEGGEDLLIELTPEAFDLLCSRSVDHGALKQTKLHTRGIIICCEIEETDQKSDSRRRSEGDLSVGPLDGLDFRSRCKSCQRCVSE